MVGTRRDGALTVAAASPSGHRANHGKVMRVLSGFATHPNVGGVLFVEQGTEELRTEDLLRYMAAHGYPIAEVPHAAITLSGDHQVGALPRTPHPCQPIYPVP